MVSEWGAPLVDATDPGGCCCAAWHISGGEGWAANTTCRRVLVTHTDGSQTVEEIENDMDIEGDDVDAMKAQLRKQGVTDLVSIDLHGYSTGLCHSRSHTPRTGV